ncbi:MAG: pyridoxal-phosphate dependent enzyme, partial [Candidatus Hodgkinia cicadicola]
QNQEMNKKEKPFTSVIQATGGTPIVRLARLEAKYIKTQLYAKLEFMNPLGSVKDRIANALILLLLLLTLVLPDSTSFYFISKFCSPSFPIVSYSFSN